MKKIISILLSLVLLMCTSATTFAQTIDSQILTLAEEYGIEVKINGASSEFSELPQISLEQYQELLASLAESSENEIAVERIINIPAKRLSQRVAMEDSYTWQVWAPFRPNIVEIGTITVCKECTAEFSYQYVNGAPQFISYSDVTSTLSGIGCQSWTQTSKAVNFSKTNTTKDTIKVKVTGNGYFGFDVSGTIVGVKYPSETWNFSLVLTPEQ